jgi:uncharacterized membrane protein YeiH
MAAILGMISGIRGGMVRDVLTAQVPTVLRADIYAVAALVVVAGTAAGLLPTAVALSGIALCVFLRLMALQPRLETACGPITKTVARLPSLSSTVVGAY